MPLIQRIEISNFMNSGRVEPWRPDWPHQVFDLNAENTAMNIPNGKGKSSLVLSLLAMLTAHMKSINELRGRHYAPRRTGRYTHIRLQVLITLLGEGSNDLVGMAGGDLAGNPMVFGLYGNSGENERVNFYAYRGTLEDCPIAHVHQMRHDLVADKEFLEALRARPGVFKDPSSKEWLAYLDDYFDMSNLKQQFVYQMARGAEGDSNYFEAKLPGKSYAASVFYERLAPELLSEVMGELGEDGEHGIEDTIHEKVSKLIVAKRNTAKKAEELQRTENTMRELEDVLEKGQALIASEKDYEVHKAEFATEVAAIKNVLIEDPIPGIPNIPPEHLTIARSMVMQGRDGLWYLPDRVMAEFTGETPSDVNRRASDRNGIPLTQTNKSQLIEFACHLKTRDARGKPNQLYTRSSALALLNVTTNFIEDWTREKAIAAVTEAFDWVDANADSNPARQLDHQLSHEIDTKTRRWKELSSTFDGYIAEREELRKEQQSISEQQAEYRRMVDSRLFTDAELANPTQTRIAVTAEHANADAELNLHKDKVRDLKEVFSNYAAFVAQHGDTVAPREVGEQLLREEQAAKNVEKEVDGQLKEARARRQPLKVTLIEAEKTQAAAERRHARFMELAPQVEAFNRLFGNESFNGLEAAVKSTLKSAKDRMHLIERALSGMEGPLNALTRFRSLHGDIDPANWIADRLKEWEAVGVEISRAKESKSDAEQRRSDLDKAAVAPGRVARETMAAAGGAPQSLHVAIEGMELSAERKEAVLTLFSALLHAPVYSTLGEAAEAARRLADQEIESPVFVLDELASFCRSANDISVEHSTAHTWLVGVRTRPVDCLLDPSLVDREKAQVETRIASLTDQIEHLNKKRTLLAADHEDAADAPAAAHAIKDELEAKSAALHSEISDINKQLPRLEERASEDAINAIRSKIEFSRHFSDNDSEQSLVALLNAAISASKATESSYNSNEAIVESLEQQRDLLVNARANAEQLAKQVPVLKRIQAFLDHPTDNPAFMRSAQVTEVALSERLSVAIERVAFRFELAEAFVRNGGERPQWIENRITAIGLEIEAIQARLLPQINGELEILRKRSLEAKDKAGEIDELVRKLTRKYREFLNEGELIDIRPGNGYAQHPIIDLADAARGETDISEKIARLIDLVEDIDVVNTSSLSKKMSDSRQKYLAAKNALGNQIDLMMARSNLDLAEHVRIELLRGKEDVSVLAHIYNVTKTNYEKNNAANATAQLYLDQEWGDISGWLQKFTLRLPDNLRIMRETFAPERDSATKVVLRAGFDISAKIAEKQDIRSTLNDIVRMVEEYENNSEAINQFAPGGKAKAVTTLRREIRNNFYQKVLLEPAIHVCMPSISQRPLLLEKDMVSTGQGIAMALLWIVKMAHYVSEREMARQTVSSAQLKRLKANKTQFTIIDGAFSSLSKKELIDDALHSVTKSRGNFQLIITGHDENYQNNFTYFPTLIVAREVNGRFMYADSKTRRLLQPSEVGSHYGALNSMNIRMQPINKDTEAVES